MLQSRSLLRTCGTLRSTRHGAAGSRRRAAWVVAGLSTTVFTCWQRPETGA